MAKKEPKEGDYVRLLNARNLDGEPELLPEAYQVVKIIDRHSMKVADEAGVKMNVHRSRAKITEAPRGINPRQEEPVPDTAIPQTEREVTEQAPQVQATPPEAPQAETPKEVEAPKAPEAVAPKAEEPKVAEPKKATPKKAAKKATKKAKPAAKKATKPAAKKATKEDKLQPFDQKAWIGTCGGGTHLKRKCKFDHANYELWAHVCVNGQTGYYYTLNVYKYPSGVVSVGKKNTDGNKFPLKGKRMSKRVKVKKTGKMESRPCKGKETAEALVARLKKEGYTQVSST